MKGNKTMMFRILAMTAAALLANAAGYGLRGQDAMMKHGYLSGPISSISQGALTLQGASLALTSSTAFIGMDGSGNLAALSWTDFQTEDVATVFEENQGGAPVATAVYLGQTFMMQGTVTDLQTDDQGKPVLVTIDAAFAIHVAQASVDGMDPADMGNGMGGNMNGGMGSGGMMGGGMGGGMMGNGESDLIQVGSTVALGGIVDNGTFGAVFVHVMASLMMGGGTIQSLTYDIMNNVTGFTMTRQSHSTQVLFDASTQITKHGQPMPANSLQANMHVKVEGLSRQDGSILAQSVIVKGGMGGMH